MIDILIKSACALGIIAASILGLEHARTAIRTLAWKECRINAALAGIYGALITALVLVWIRSS